MDGEFSMNVGIIFYSRSGNTRQIAERIKNQAEEHDHTVNVVEVIPVKQPGFLKAGYSAIRQKELPIKNDSLDVSSWDVVLVGCPIWAGKPAPFIKTLLKNTSHLNGKKTSMFITCSGGSESKTVNLLKSYLEGKQAKISNKKLIVHMNRKGKIKEEMPSVEDFTSSVLNNN
jgi:flavodoxin